MTANEAIGVLQKIETEERNWRAARVQLGDLLTAAIEAEEVVQRSAREETRIRSSISDLTREREDLQRQIADLMTQLSGFNAQLAAKKQEEQDALAEVRSQRQAEETRLGEIQKQLAAMRSTLNATA